MDRVQAYVNEMHLTLDRLPLEKVNPLIGFLNHARLSNRQVFTMGNGGRVAMAAHFVSELAVDLDWRDQLRRILQLILEGIGATSGSIMVLDEEGNVLEGALAYAGQVLEKNVQQLAEIFERGLAGWVAENRQAALIADTKHDPRWFHRSWEENQDTARSAISVPLLVNDRVFGVLTLVHSQAGRFTQDDLRLLTAITMCMSFVNYVPKQNYQTG